MGKMTLAQKLALSEVLEHAVFEKLDSDIKDCEAKQKIINQYLDYWIRVHQAVDDFLDGRDQAKDAKEEAEAIALAGTISP